MKIGSDQHKKRRRRADGGNDFSATQAGVFLAGFTFRGFVEECCVEHQRRMDAFDPDLLRPSFLPKLAGAALARLRRGSSLPAMREERA